MEERSKAPGISLLRALVAGGAAGIIGGLAEVAFMGVYSSIAGINAAEVLRLVTFTFFDAGAAFGANGHWAGLLIHFGLSLAIGLCFGIFARIAFRDDFSYPRALVWGVTALAAIWATNFYILLPMYNGAFVRLVSPEAAFFSKFFFGVTLALSMRLACPMRKKAVPRATPSFAPRLPRGEVNDSARISENDVRGLVS
ncbi:MAG: hypothetical protein Q8P48_08010 [Deltaproteobacteria bacterium]|nr:hypothetical protein [Deltaproteobacteria bacterium]